jgi:hypothetical protein
MRLLKKQWALIAGTLVFPLLVLFFLMKISQLVSQKRIYTKDISFYLKDGDIICRLGDRLWSQYFKDISLTDKRFSHLGIIKINNDKITVINAEGRAIQGKDFVNEVDLDEFLKIAKAVGIYRLNNYEGGNISSEAMEYIGYPFDWNFDLTNENKIYCTELLYVILKKIAPEIELKKIYQKELNKEIIPLEACSDSEYFKEILYIKVAQW